MSLLKALGLGIAVYLGGVLAVLLIPVFVILCLWSGLCVAASILLFAFWLLVTHSPHTLALSAAMLAWGAPPCLAAFLLGYYGGRFRVRRNAITLSPDAPFR
jgi:hypothetical protein